ncbi:MAG: C40 family peptidase [Candidatus Thiodiazotropha sp.]|jgi:cell wall-associated NlpC family hydrolase
MPILNSTNTLSRYFGRLLIPILTMVFISAQFSACTTVSKPASSKATNTGQEKQDLPLEPTYTVVDIAEGLKGKPYRYGGVTPKGFDCSGFVQYAYRKAGMSIPRTTRDQYRVSQRLPLEKAKPGDLLFFKIDSRKLSHVGLYAGNGRFIHASTAKKRVADALIHDPYWRNRLIGIGRIY